MPIDRRFRDVVNNHSIRTGIRLSGPFASPRLVDAIRRSVKTWTRETGFRFPVAGIDQAGFDDALDAAGSYLSSSLGDDLIAFVSDMKQEAMHALREGAGRPDGTTATLFALPMDGDPSSIEDLANDPARLESLAASLVRTGVAAPGSRVAFVRGCLTPSQMLVALPGRIRRVLDMILDSDPSGRVPEAVSAAVHALLSEAPRGRPEVPEAVESMSARVLIGIRVLRTDADGEVPIDYYSALMPEAVSRDFVAMGTVPSGPVLVDGPEDGPEEEIDPIPEAPELDAWLSEANAAHVRAGVTFALPDHWARATSVTACMQLQRLLAASLAGMGATTEAVEALHVHMSERTVGLAAVVAGGLVGPVTAARCLVSADPTQLELLLSSYGVQISYHEEGDPFPALAA